MNDKPVKIIHYCWFGPNKLSKLALKCIESWKKYLPDYEIKLWNEDNFDFNQNIFVKQAYEQKKWAFVSDYARLKAISEYGGVYFDTDIEIVKNMDEILNHECFMGIEDSNLVNAAVIGASTPHNHFIDDMIKIYESHQKFDSENIYTISIPTQITKKLNEYGFNKYSNEIQKLYDNSITIYPREYFYPLSYDHQNNLFTDNTHTIHHFDATWASVPEKTTLFFRRHNMKFMVRIVDFFVILKNIILSIVKDKAFWIFTLITILFFGIFIKLQYATDTYSIFESGFNAPFEHFISLGRFTIAAFWTITFNLGMYLSYIMSFILAILCITFSVYKLYKIINKKVENNILSGIISILTIINLFSIELFLFFEKGMLCFSILMCVLSIDFLVKFFENKTKKRFLISLIFMTLAVFSYQGTIAIFIALGTIFVLKYSKSLKDFIINNLTIASIYGIPCLVNYFMVNFLPNLRVTGQSINLINNIEKIINTLPNMIIDGYGILPKHLFLIFITLTIIVALILIIIDKKKIFKILFDIIKLIYIYIAIIIFTLLPQVILNYNSIWLVPRCTYAFASIIGITLIYLCYNICLKNKIKISLVIVFSVIYLCLQYVGFQNIARDHYTLNYMDRYICEQIGDKIIEYEKNNEKKIENIVFYKDKNVTHSYQNIETAYGDTNVKAFYMDFSILGLINQNLNRKLINLNSTNVVIEEYFKNNDWNYFDENQIIFKNNTMHLCVF